MPGTGMRPPLGRTRPVTAHPEVSEPSHHVQVEARFGLQVLHLAEDAGPVPGTAERVPQERNVVTNRLEALRAVAVGPAAGHYRRPAGQADGDGDVRSVEGHA